MLITTHTLLALTITYPSYFSYVQYYDICEIVELSIILFSDPVFCSDYRQTRNCYFKFQTFVKSFRLISTRIVLKPGLKILSHYQQYLVKSCDFQISLIERNRKATCDPVRLTKSGDSLHRMGGHQSFAPYKFLNTCLDFFHALNKGETLGLRPSSIK